MKLNAELKTGVSKKTGEVWYMVDITDIGKKVFLNDTESKLVALLLKNNSNDDEYLFEQFENDNHSNLLENEE